MQQRKVNIYLYVSRMKGVGIAEAKDTSTQPMSAFTVNIYIFSVFSVNYSHKREELCTCISFI